MSASQVVIKNGPPMALEFAALRSLVGWKNPELGVLQASMESTLFWVSAYSENELIGTGRVIGDGAMYFYIQDVIVHPGHQKVGLGSQIMESINHYLAVNYPAGSTVGLLAAQGKEKFYEKFEFISRNGQKLGLGMCRFT